MTKRNLTPRQIATRKFAAKVEATYGFGGSEFEPEAVKPYVVLGVRFYTEGEALEYARQQRAFQGPMKIGH